MRKLPDAVRVAAEAYGYRTTKENTTWAIFVRNVDINTYLEITAHSVGGKISYSMTAHWYPEVGRRFQIKEIDVAESGLHVAALHHTEIHLLAGLRAVISSANRYKK